MPSTPRSASRSTFALPSAFANSTLARRSCACPTKKLCVSKEEVVRVRKELNKKFWHYVPNKKLCVRNPSYGRPICRYAVAHRSFVIRLSSAVASYAVAYRSFVIRLSSAVASSVLCHICAFGFVCHILSLSLHAPYLHSGSFQCYSASTYLYKRLTSESITSLTLRHHLRRYSRYLRRYSRYLRRHLFVSGLTLLPYGTFLASRVLRKRPS